MSEIEIMLKEVIGKDLGSRNLIENIFKSIDSNVSEVVMNFEGVEFMGRSFAQEYLNRKFASSFSVVEKNVPEDVDMLFNIILKQNDLL